MKESALQAAGRLKSGEGVRVRSQRLAKMATGMLRDQKEKKPIRETQETKTRRRHSGSC